MKFFSLEEKNLLKKISEKTITKKDLENEISLIKNSGGVNSNDE